MPRMLSLFLEKLQTLFGLLFQLLFSLPSFGGWKGALGGIGNFIEELLPGIDFIPSFTIMWFLQHNRKKNINTSPEFSG
jgi:hypothetical protein